MRPERAFTLPEVLVVTAIILIIIALLLPAAGYLRAIAQRVVCAGNLGQLGRLMRSYAQDNKGFLPAGEFPAYSVPEWDPSASGGPVMALLQYAEDWSVPKWGNRYPGGIYSCPRLRVLDPHRPQNYYIFPYGTNSDLGKVDLVHRAHLRNRRPEAERIVFADPTVDWQWNSSVFSGARTNYGISPFPDLCALRPDEPPTIRTGGLIPLHARGRMHRGRVNLLYLDGRVVSIDSTAMPQGTTCLR